MKKKNATRFADVTGVFAESFCLDYSTNWYLYFSVFSVGRTGDSTDERELEEIYV